MIAVCLGCGFVSGGGLFCPSCGLGLGHKVCEKGHKNPLGAAVRVCAACGGELLEGARALRIGWLPAAMSAATLVFGWKLLVANAVPAASATVRAAVAVTAFLFNSTPGAVRSLCMEAAAAWLLAWLGGEAMRLLPNRGGWMGARLRGLPLSTAVLAWRLLLVAAKAGFRLARRAAFGPPPKRGAAHGDGAGQKLGGPPGI